MTEATEFEKWMERFKGKFTTYSDQEVQDLAIACGFGREEVCAWFANSDRRAA